MQLRAIRNHVIFQFVEGFYNGAFQRASASGIILPGTTDDSIRGMRWGKIVTVGPLCSDYIRTPGCEILIEPLKWTAFFEFEGEKYWRTDETVIAGFRLPEDEKSSLLTV